MATLNVTTSKNIDAVTGKVSEDTYNIQSDATLTIDQDTRTGVEATTSTTLGNVTINTSSGGHLLVDGRKVRLIPYDTGTGNVPAWNTAITIGSATGKLIGVYSALTAASTATGAAMPASGYLKIKQWNDVAYTAGALGGISANATGADVVGWLEIVGVEASTMTIPQLGDAQFLGEWYKIGTTNGSSNQTMQIPNNGLLRYAAGVFIEKTAGQADYEFYPNAGTTTTTGTEAARGKVVWIDNAGLVRIGNSGAATNGYTPATGLAVVIGNIFCENHASGFPTTNAIPNASVGSRYDFTATNGTFTFDKCNIAWFCYFVNPYSVTITNTGTIDSMELSGCKTAITWSKLGIGNKPTTALNVTGLNINNSIVGGTLTDCVVDRAGHTGTGGTLTLTQASNYTFVRPVLRGTIIRTSNFAYSAILLRCGNITFTDPLLIQGSITMDQCDNISGTGIQYVDCVSGTTLTTNAVSLFQLTYATKNCSFSGLTFPVTNTHPYAAIALFSQSSSDNLIHTIGTRAAPVSLGSVNATNLLATFASGAVCSGNKFKRIYLSNTRAGALVTGDSSQNGTEMINVFGDYADNSDTADMLNFVRQGVGGDLTLGIRTGVYGTHWFDCFRSTTTGRIGIKMNKATAETAAQVTINGVCKFTGTGILFFPDAGTRECVWETPNYIIGHTSFQNLAAVVGGGAAITVNFQIDINNGAGYSAWAVASGANLSGITGIDASLGFKLKIQAIRTAASTFEMEYIYLETNSTTTAQDFQYPLDTVTIKFTAKDAATLGVVEGARVYVTAAAGGDLAVGTVILNGLTNASGYVQDTAFEYSGNPQPITGRIRKSTSAPLYKTGMIGGTITAAGIDLTTFIVKDE